jgi:nucleoside-diphosphate-sugar epimerase
MKRTHRPLTDLKRDIVDAEAAVADFAEKNDATVTVMRFCNVLGPDLSTSHARLLALPAVPMIAGFDPRYQFVHADDVVSSLFCLSLNFVALVGRVEPTSSHDRAIRSSASSWSPAAPLWLFPPRSAGAPWPSSIRSSGWWLA